MRNATKRELLSWIEQDREALVAFFSGFVKAKSPNPPGDTREAVAFLCRFLESQNISYKIIAPQAMMPNLVSSSPARAQDDISSSMGTSMCFRLAMALDGSVTLGRRCGKRCCVGPRRR